MRTTGMRPRRRVASGALVGALALLGSLMTPAAAYPRPGATERVSVASDGAEGNRFSVRPAVSSDGRFVAFESTSTNLVPGDTNNTRDVFVRDREAGSTERVSVASDGTEADSPSFDPAISADGRYVAFDSAASNLVPDKTNQCLVRSSTVGWALVPCYDVFVHDRETGTTERVSVASDGSEAVGNDTAAAVGGSLVQGSVHAAISADGRYVAFDSDATNLVPLDANDERDVFVHDLQAGTTERVSVASDGIEGNDASSFPTISADGRYVAFHSDATNLVPADTNNAPDVFVHDRETGTTERVSVASDGTEGTGGLFGIGPGARPEISADGRYVAFGADFSNLVPGDDNERFDAFVHDLQTGVTERVSVGWDGREGNHASTIPSISADGRHVAFDSFASNLVPDDANAVLDIFVRDRGPATGVGALEVGKAPGELLVSGWAAFSGAPVASAEDPGDDGRDALGAEITGASIIHRPEREELLLRLELTSLPHVSPRNVCQLPNTSPGPVCPPTIGAGAAAVLYRWSFTAEQTAYEVRALRAAATADPPTTDPYFALYECTASCTETARLSGGIGTTGTEVRVSVPMGAVGAEEGTELADIEASAALGEATPGALVVLDDVALPDASIPVPRVELGIAPPSAPQSDVAFSTQAELVEGRFSATLDTSSLTPGAHRVWARACLGQTCGAEWVEVAL